MSAASTASFAGLIRFAQAKRWAPMMGGLQAVYVREIKLWKRFHVVSTIETWEDTQVIGRHRFELEDGQTAALVMTTAGIYNFGERRFMPIAEIITELGHQITPRPPSEEERIFMSSHAGLRKLAKSQR